MKQRYVYRDGRMVDRDGMPMLTQYDLAGEPCAPQVMRDTEPYRSPIDGRWITSRSWRREDMARNGCVEADPPKRKRGLKNERFARKHGHLLNPEICKDQNAAERHNARLSDARKRRAG
jgi:hypothetical protein